MQMLKNSSSSLFRHLVSASPIGGVGGGVPAFLRSPFSVSSTAMSSKFWFVQYDYIPNVIEKRGPHRANHLNYAGKFRDSGKLIIGGAFNPPEAAGLVFKSNDKSEVEKFCKEDPYVTNGLVTKYTIREWNVVVSSIDDSNLKL